MSLSIDIQQINVRNTNQLSWAIKYLVPSSMMSFLLWEINTALCVFGKRGPKMFNFKLLFLHGFSSKNCEIWHKAVLTSQEYMRIILTFLLKVQKTKILIIENAQCTEGCFNALLCTPTLFLLNADLKADR